MATCVICNEDEYSKSDIRLCRCCFDQASRLISSLAKLGESETLNCALSKSKQLEAALHRIDLLEPYLAFVTQNTAAFTDQIHADILLKPGRDDGPLIPAHKALLAAKSIVFKNMLDICEAPPDKDAILTFMEMNHEELETFLEFLYKGKLSKEALNKHASSLFSAARKYDISFLEKFLEREMVRNLETENALEILKIAVTFSNKVLKSAALQLITTNTSVALSSEFHAFACKNISLAVEVFQGIASARNLRERSCST